jgi:hypothetical protein
MLDEQPIPTPGDADLHSTLPPPPPPSFAPFTTSAPPSPNQRPTAALVIGILLVVFAGLGAVGVLVNIVQLAIPIPMEDSGMRPMSLIASVIGSVSIVLQAVAGIGLLRLLRWARKFTIYAMIVTFCMGVFSSIFMMSHLSSVMPTVPDAASKAVVGVAMTGGLVLGMLFAVVENGLIIFFLTRPHVVAAFRHRGEH